MKKKIRKIVMDQTLSLLNDKKDTSPIIPQRSKIKSDLHIIENFIFTEKQKEFFKIALDKNTKLLFVSGPAGSAKTYLTVYCALKLLHTKRVSDLIYVRSAVECSDKSIGFLPGSVDEKISVYIQPLLNKLEELLPKNEIELLKKENRITSIPIGFLRGLNWNAKVVIGDEFQNCTYKEIITYITRIGKFSKVFMLGDCDQSDLKNGNRGGFENIINKFDDEESKQNGIFVFRFTEDDIVRSELVKFIVKRLNLSI